MASTIRTVAAIPTINSAEWTIPLAEHLLLADKIDELRIYDAGDDFTSRWARHRRRLDDRLVWIDNRKRGIYDTWNGVIKEHSHEPTNVAVLNADIRLPPNALRDIFSGMRDGGFVLGSVDPARPAMHSQHHAWWNRELAAETRPDENHGNVIETMGTGSVGWAFMVAAEFWADKQFAIHPAFEWWYGDDDLWRRTRQAGGRTCIVCGIGCDHLGSVSDPYNPGKSEKIERDRANYEEIWE